MNWQHRQDFTNSLVLVGSIDTIFLFWIFIDTIFFSWIWFVLCHITNTFTLLHSHLITMLKLILSYINYQSLCFTDIISLNCLLTKHESTSLTIILCV